MDRMVCLEDRTMSRTFGLQRLVGKYNNGPYGPMYAKKCKLDHTVYALF